MSRCCGLSLTLAAQELEKAALAAGVPLTCCPLSAAAGPIVIAAVVPAAALESWPAMEVGEPPMREPASELAIVARKSSLITRVQGNVSALVVEVDALALVVSHSKLVVAHGKLVAVHHKLVVVHGKLVVVHGTLAVIHGKPAVVHGTLVVVPPRPVLHSHIVAPDQHHRDIPYESPVPYCVVQRFQIGADILDNPGIHVRGSNVGTRGVDILLCPFALVGSCLYW